MKPGLVGVDKAVDVLMRAVRTHPATVSYPRRISAAARLLSLIPSARLRLGRKPR